MLSKYNKGIYEGLKARHGLTAVSQFYLVILYESYVITLIISLPHIMYYYIKI
jgi:hypothetical protein